MQHCDMIIVDIKPTAHKQKCYKCKSKLNKHGVRVISTGWRWNYYKTYFHPECYYKIILNQLHKFENDLLKFGMLKEDLTKRLVIREL